jgi:hypothetical protein
MTAGDEGEAQPDPIQETHQLRLGPKQENVVGAVVPAAEVEERISEKRPADAVERGGAVDDRHDQARGTTDDSAPGSCQHEVQEKRRDEWRHDHGHTVCQGRGPSQPTQF